MMTDGTRSGNSPVEPGGAAVLAATFVELTGLAVRGSDPVDMFMRISQRAVGLLPVEACGILLRDPGGVLHAVGSSSTSARVLDLFQVQNEEGPCLECLTTCEPVSVDAGEASHRWPRFAALLAVEGFTTVHAFPMASRGIGFGALNLFALDTLDDEQRSVAQALADIASLVLLQSDVVEDAMVVARRLHLSVQVRATVGQAIGVIAERFALDPDSALRMLQATANEQGVTLAALAAAVVVRDPSSRAAQVLNRPMNRFFLAGTLGLRFLAQTTGPDRRGPGAAGPLRGLLWTRDCWWWAVHPVSR